MSVQSIDTKESNKIQWLQNNWLRIKSYKNYKYGGVVAEWLSHTTLIRCGFESG